MKTEEWRDISGYEGIYQASTHGSIRSCPRTVRQKNGVYKTLKGRTLSQCATNAGYMIVQLYKNGCRRGMLVHRLVAMTFVRNPECKPYNNHIDGDKLNNCANNLEWVTQSENMRHAVDNGLWVYPGKTAAGRRRLSEQCRVRFKGVPKTKEHNEKNRLAQIGRDHSYSYRKVRCINNGKVYDSVKQVLSEFGISYNKFYWRVNHKMEGELQFEYCNP